MKLAILALAAALAATPFALADDRHADCEPGQTTYIYGDSSEGDPERPRMCEGEHWDGRDMSDSPDSSDYVLETGSGIYVASASGKSPRSPDLEQNGVFDVFHTRLSIQYLGNTHVYWYGGLYGVGETAVDVDDHNNSVAWWGKDGTNQGPLGPVWESAIAAFNPDADEGGADGNIIAFLVGYFNILPRGMKTGEDDCTQEEYQTNDCERDNTAVTMELP